MKLTKRIKTALYGDQRFSSLELELIHTPAFQRLYDLHQLGLTDRVFLDASHSRLHHVMGAVEQATNLMKSLARNLRRDAKKQLRYTTCGGVVPTGDHFASLVKKRIPTGRLMALLHDLTHAPYGHTLEDEIHLVSEKHDEPDRQAHAFYSLTVQFLGWLLLNVGATDGQRASEVAIEIEKLQTYLIAPHLEQPPQDGQFLIIFSKQIAEAIERLDTRRTVQPFLTYTTSDLAMFLKQLRFGMRALLYLEAAHHTQIQKKHLPATEGSYAFERLLSATMEHLNISVGPEDSFDPHRDAFMLDVIGNTICADLLDYAKRDAFYAGLKLDYDAARIVENFTLVSHNQAGARVLGDSTQKHPFQQHSIRTAISLFSHKLRTDVPGELLNLLQVRYYVYERMLYHPTKCIAGAMMGAAIQLIGWKSLPLHFRSTGDAVFLHDTAEAARVVLALITEDVLNKKAYNQDVAESLVKKLQVMPTTSVKVAAEQLIRDRVSRVRDVTLKLETIQHFSRASAVTHLIRRELEKLKLPEDANFTEESMRRVLDQLPQPVKDKAYDVLAPLVSTPKNIEREIRSGLILLSRVTARQFFKAVFRLLPNVKVPDADNFTPEDIANRFLNSATRFVAEREIERLAGLPPGTIAIHCPKADGPKKIANILISPGLNQGDKCHQLREIGELHPPMFRKHQEAINALQEMYASMWRLVVSASPEYTAKWALISNAAGEVLYRILSEGNDVGGPAPNDPYMEQELRASLAIPGAETVPVVTIMFPDGSEQLMPLQVFETLVNGKANSNAQALEGLAAEEGEQTETLQTSRISALINQFDSITEAYLGQTSEKGRHQITAARARFLKNMEADPNRQEAWSKKLEMYRIDLLPGEKLAHNRATATSFLAELEDFFSSHGKGN